MNRNRQLIRWLACILCAMGWFCTSGCTRPSNQDTNADTGAHANALSIPTEFVQGQSLYEKNCSSCHDTSRDGAPRLGFAPAWKRRIAQGEDTLVRNAIEGLDLMPPRGDNASLTDEQIGQIVKYMMYRAELGIPVEH